MTEEFKLINDYKCVNTDTIQHKKILGYKSVYKHLNVKFQKPQLSTVTCLESSVFALSLQSWIPIPGLVTLPKQVSSPTPRLSEVSRHLYGYQQLSS